MYSRNNWINPIEKNLFVALMTEVNVTQNPMARITAAKCTCPSAPLDIL